VSTWLATWFGCGYAPVAPGTAGSAAALAIAVLLHEYAGWTSLWIAVLGIVFVTPAVWSSGALASRIGKHDPGIVVIDEVVGQWLTIAGLSSYSWRSWLAAFLLFRLFDVVKPPPARQLERLPGGFGIVADDIMAGAYAALVLYATASWNWY